jgi:acetolactate synthase-1/2/3 large subunit
MAESHQTGGQLVCAALTAAGCRVIFSVSGNQILPIFDAAPEAGIRIVHMRHESAAAYAAAAFAELSGAVGVALTSAGPGFLAGLQGVAAARTMELPLLYLSGDSAAAQRGMGAFQELAQSAIAVAVCKATFNVNGGAEIPAVFAQAIASATSGVPGPVHIALPGDLLAAGALPEIAPATSTETRLNGSERAQVEEIARRLQAAERPLILARPSAARGVAGEHLAAIAAALGIAPIVIEAPRGLADLKYASISARFPESDCALIVGPPDFALGFLARTHLASAGSILLVDAAGDPAPSQPVDLHLRADTLAVLAQLRARLPGTASASPEWSALWPLPAPPEASGAPTAGVHPLAVSAALRAALGPEDVVVLDGGEFCQWIRLGLRDMPNPVLWNGKVGAIGGAIPMSVGAAVAAPGRRIVAVMGDGGAGYHLSEFETMDRYGLAITALIGNDARWAAEWHLQIARYGPERTIETELTNARYERVAMGFNAAGEHITDAAELPEALHEALGRRGATCLNVEVAALPSPAAMS